MEDKMITDAIALRAHVDTEDLVRQFRGTFGRETIERIAAESFAKLMERATIYTHVPLLATRFTRERLQALAHAEGLVKKAQPEILFVCVHNAGRSQMAARLAAHLSGGQVHVRSAGSAPSGQVEQNVVAAMAEMGLNLSEAFPKPLTDEVVRAADVVITMGCGDACPLYPGKRYLDWEVADPAGQPLTSVRRIREDLRARVRTLLLELGVREDTSP
jgi:arsenate reductase